MLSATFCQSLNNYIHLRLIIQIRLLVTLSIVDEIENRYKYRGVLTVCPPDISIGDRVSRSHIYTYICHDMGYFKNIDYR